SLDVARGGRGRPTVTTGSRVSLVALLAPLARDLLLAVEVDDPELAPTGERAERGDRPKPGALGEEELGRILVGERVAPPDHRRVGVQTERVAPGEGLARQPEVHTPDLAGHDVLQRLGPEGPGAPGLAGQELELFPGPEPEEVEELPHDRALARPGRPDEIDPGAHSRSPSSAAPTTSARTPGA